MWNKTDDFIRPRVAVQTAPARGCLRPRRSRGRSARGRRLSGTAWTRARAAGCPRSARETRSTRAHTRTAGAARSTGETTPTRTHPGAHPRAGEDKQPLSRPGRRATTWATGSEHLLVMVAPAVVISHHGTGKENVRHDEDDPRDDHDPRRDLIKPVWLFSVSRRWGWRRRRSGRSRLRRQRRRCGRSRLRQPFRYFTHLSIMPRRRGPVQPRK